MPVETKETPAKPKPLIASPIQAPFDEAPPPELGTEERAPADPLEHFRKHQCSHGHKNWDPEKIVFSVDNKRWILKCLDCYKNEVPCWYTITGSSMVIEEQRVATATVQK
jgi:hypothetical protein